MTFFIRPFNLWASVCVVIKPHCLCILFHCIGKPGLCCIMYLFDERLGIGIKDKKRATHSLLVSPSVITLATSHIAELNPLSSSYHHAFQPEDTLEKCTGDLSSLATCFWHSNSRSDLSFGGGSM